MNKTIIYLAMVITLMNIVIASSISVTSDAPTQNGGIISITATLSSQTGINGWKVTEISIPAGWTFVDKQVTGYSGAEHNEICGYLDSGKYSCSMLAGPGSVVANKLIIQYRVNSAVTNPPVSGRLETYGGGSLQNTDTFDLSGGQSTCGTTTCGDWSICSNGAQTRTCTDTDCTGSNISKPCGGLPSNIWTYLVIGGIIILFFTMKKK